ncbi:hypothetical protein IKF92_01140 [Candidatus Saccharibacteria bacterium]|nr:hypothetical protein [Candidatus Saccharibacteria bacterium]
MSPTYWICFTPAARSTPPIKTALAGRWYGSLGDTGTNGYWRSPVVNGDGGSYHLDANSDGRVTPDFSSARDDGFSVRCLAR